MRVAILFLIAAGTGLAAVASAPQGYSKAEELYNHADYPGVIAMLGGSPTGVPNGAPQDPRTLELLGRAYLMSADYKHATEALEKAAAMDPGNSMTQTWLGRAYGRRAETSFALSAAGYATKAREAFETAVRLDSRNGEALDDLFEYYLQAPGFLGGGFDKARKLLPLIGQIDPTQVHIAEAHLAEEKKDFNSAEGELRRALLLAPQKVSRVLELARFLAKHGKTDESDRVLAQGLKAHPDSRGLLYASAEIWIKSNRNLEQARGLLNQYLASPNLAPGDPSRSEVLKLLRKTYGG